MTATQFIMATLVAIILLTGLMYLWLGKCKMKGG